jgi:exopolyphosphatase / guanosine-5'-triphosphate,3'-diphosphate pyrophosphatase
LAALSPERLQEGDETYLVSLESDACAKLRGGRLNLKRLLQRDGNGLEQWAPVMDVQAPFPAAEVHAIVEALDAEHEPLAREQYEPDELLQEVVMPNPGLLAVGVHKRRQHYTIGGCMAELSQVKTSRGDRRTIAVESEDPAHVIAVVRDLGLASRANVSFPRELEALVSGRPRRYAVIDVGTNSVKLHVGERSSSGEWRTVADRAEVTKLGEGADGSGRLADQSISRTVSTVTAMVEEARRQGAEAIAAVGTAALRRAPNQASVLEAARERAGVVIEVIEAGEEARLAYLAARSGVEVGSGSLVVFDTGGGSSQFTFGSEDRVDEQFSLPLGAIAITERYGMSGVVAEATLASALEEISAQLTRLDGRPAPDAVVGMGGVVTNLTAVKLHLATYDPDRVQAAELDRAEIDRQIELYRAQPADERRRIVGLQEGRAEVILAGACIVRTVLTKLDSRSLVVSDRGLRHGVLLERFG